MVWTNLHFSLLMYRLIKRFSFEKSQWFLSIKHSSHTGVLSKMFAIKSCTNPARHTFPWLPGEAVGLHTGVLTKTFAMSVLYLKSELNFGLGAINGEEARKADGHGSQRACFPMSLCGVHLTRFLVSLRIGLQLARLPFSQALKHLSARDLLAIKRLRRCITWMVNKTHTI